MPPTFDMRVDELDETSPRAAQVDGISIRLWPHQLAMFHRCRMLETQKLPLDSFKSLTGIAKDDFLKTQVGIIGDAVGSGKSYVILALIQSTIASYNASENESTVKAYGNNKVMMCFAEKCKTIKTNLLVIPHNLVSQWQLYIQNFNKDMKYMLVSKAKHLDNITLRPADDFLTYDLIIVTGSFYPGLAHFITSHSFKVQRVIYDEIDNISLPNCLPLESRFYWFVTASYGNLLCPRGFTTITGDRTLWHADGIRNSGFVKELFMDLYNNLSVDLVKTIIVKNNDDFIKLSITLPEIQTRVIQCQTPRMIHTLDGFVNRDVIQSLNAGDEETALRLINPWHISSESGIIAILIEKLQRESYNMTARIKFTECLQYEDEVEKQNEIARLNVKVREIEAKIEGIHRRIRETDMCCICYDDINTKSIVPCCSNAFCFKCLTVWLSNHPSCPLCKHSVHPQNVMVIKENAETSKRVDTHEANDAQLDKQTNLEIIMKSFDSTRKIIIYSAYETTFQKVAGVLNKLNIKFNYLKGNDGQLNAIVNSYKQGDTNVLLANTRHYGSGMNMENTTDIIMFHKIDSMMEKQVIGRAQRYGRTCPLTVWYLLYENEMTEMAT